MGKFGWVGVFVLALGGLAFAGDGSSAAPDSWIGALKGLGAGALAGLPVAWLGYAKNKDASKKWDMKEAAPTLIIGAIVGAIAGFQKKDLTNPEDWYAAGTAVLLADLLAKGDRKSVV